MLFRSSPARAIPPSFPMAAAVAPALDLDKPKLQKLQRAGILKQIDQRRAEPQEPQRQMPIRFWDLGRLLQQVDAKLI